MKKNPHIIFASLPANIQDDLIATDNLVKMMFTPSFNNLKPEQKDILISHLEYFEKEQKKIKSKKIIGKFMLKLINQKRDHSAYNKSLKSAILMVCISCCSVSAFIFQNFISSCVSILLGVLISNPILTLVTSFLLTLLSLTDSEKLNSKNFVNEKISHLKSENIKKDCKIITGPGKKSKYTNNNQENIKIVIKT